MGSLGSWHPVVPIPGPEASRNLDDLCPVSIKLLDLHMACPGLLSQLFHHCTFLVLVAAGHIHPC